MKSILGGIIAAILSLFGAAHPVAHTANTPPSQAAAAAITKELAAKTDATSTDSTVVSGGTATTTIVNNYITQPVVERVVATTKSIVSEAELDAKLNQLDNKLTSLIYHWTGTQGGSPASPVINSIGAGGVWNAIAGTNKIDNLSGVTISNSTIDTASIPDLSGSYLSLKGGTVSGDLTVTGTFSGGTLNLSHASSSQLSIFGNAYFGSTATSTFDSTGALTLATPLGIGSGGTGWNRFSSGYVLFGNGSSALATSSNLFWDAAHNYLGIGTTSPAYSLDVSGAVQATDVISKGPIIDVRAYGAKGDGASDDRSAIQNAINAASAAGGGTVVFVPGATYLVSAAASTKQITANSGAGSYNYSIDVPSNVTLDFRGATLKLASGTDAVLLSNRNSANTTDSNIAIVNAFLDGNNATLTNKALVWFVGVTDLTFNARIQNTTHIAAQFANITRLYSTKMEAVNVVGQAFFIGSVATNGDVRDSYIGDITTSNITAESQPNFPGNPVAAIMTNSRIGSIEAKRSDAGIKIYWTTDRLSIGSVLLQDGGSLTSSNSGFKVQGDGTNNPKNVSVGSVTAQGQYGSGLYILYADSTHIDSYNGNGNALLGSYPDAWIAGTSTSVGQIHSINAGNIGVEIRSDASNYHLGALDIRDPGRAATGAAISVDGGTGVIDTVNALDDQGTPTMTRALDVHDPSANIRVGELHSSGQSVTAINVTAGATALIDLHGETISPTQLTGNQNNYDPSRTADVWRLSSDASRTITGIAGPWSSRQVTISNVGSFNIVLANQSVSSTDVYRIVTGTGADVTVAPSEVVTLVYDSTTQRWLLKNHLLSSLLLQSPTLAGTVVFTNTSGTTTIASGQGFTIGGSQFVLQQGSGNVGIGTLTPTRALTVAGSNEVATFGLTTASAYAAFGGERAIFGYDSGLTAATVQGLSGKGIEFNVNNNTAGQGTAMYINTSGNVGIGTTSPYALLSISNSISTSASTPLFVIASTTGGTATTTVLSVANTGNVTITGSAATCTLGNGSSATNCSSSDQRLKDDITSLDASSSLEAIRQLNPVSFKWNAWMVGNGSPTTTQFGFIAQQVAPVFGNLVSEDPNTHYYKLDYQGLFAPIVGAIQALANEVGGFADAFTTKELTFTRATGDDLTLNHQLCINKSDGTPVCVTGDQLAAVLRGTTGTPAQNDASVSAPTEPPVIQINGSNPAVIQMGASYSDLGATITGPQADLNLGIKTFLNGTLTGNIVVDTSAAATDTIDYVVTDQNGLTSTSTRTVIVQAADTPSIAPDETASSTDPTATSTATSTSQ